MLNAIFSERAVEIDRKYKSTPAIPHLIYVPFFANMNLSFIEVLRSYKAEMFYNANCVCNKSLIFNNGAVPIGR